MGLGGSKSKEKDQGQQSEIDLRNYGPPLGEQAAKRVDPVSIVPSNPVERIDKDIQSIAELSQDNFPGIWWNLKFGDWVLAANDVIFVPFQTSEEKTIPKGTRGTVGIKKSNPEESPYIVIEWPDYGNTFVNPRTGQLECSIEYQRLDSILWKGIQKNFTEKERKKKHEEWKRNYANITKYKSELWNGAIGNPGKNYGENVVVEATEDMEVNCEFYFETVKKGYAGYIKDRNKYGSCGVPPSAPTFTIVWSKGNDLTNTFEAEYYNPLYNGKIGTYTTNSQTASQTGTIENIKPVKYSDEYCLMGDYFF